MGLKYPRRNLLKDFDKVSLFFVFNKTQYIRHFDRSLSKIFNLKILSKIMFVILDSFSTVDFLDKQNLNEESSQTNSFRNTEFNSSNNADTSRKRFSSDCNDDSSSQLKASSSNDNYNVPKRRCQEINEFENCGFGSSLSEERNSGNSNKGGSI